MIATIFAGLLIKPGRRFKDVFQMVYLPFWGSFPRADKQVQREGRGKTHVLKDSFGGGNDGDVEEGDKEKTKRIARWEARRRELKVKSQNK